MGWLFIILLIIILIFPKHVSVSTENDAEYDDYDDEDLEEEELYWDGMI